jgi:hypothetical protein
MMMGMVGKRLTAAGMLAAAVAAAAALWVAPSAPPASGPPAIRQLQATVATVKATRVRVAAVLPAWQPAAPSPATMAAIPAVAAGLVLLGIAIGLPRRAVPVVARPPRRGRSPPTQVTPHRMYSRDQ